MLSCFVLCFSGRRGTLSKEAVRLSAPSLPQPEPQASLTAWGWHDSWCQNSPVWLQRLGAAWQTPISHLLPNSEAQVLCEGRLTQVMELWQSTLAESWPLLCNLLGVYLWKEYGDRPPSVGRLCRVLFAHRGPQIAVQWQSARCPGVGGIWLSTGYIPLNVFTSRQQNSAPLYTWSSK